MRLTAIVIAPDGSKSVRARVDGSSDQSELLGRRTGALGETRAVEQREGPDRRDDEHERDQPEQPGREARRPASRELVLGGGVGLAAHHETSKKPCQPSSVNSDWCAWNMNFPGCGKRHSRIPRWPWQSITVSVNSDGVLLVPVGK